ncbi:hypothetical protein T484DRAFT_1853597 [Baffinella frigidus]|nr:hypothetical protein T484DRAFT_1853597 [Cryptophyta sp. CCMP2293]
MLRALILAVAVSVTTAQTSTPVEILAPAELPLANSTTGYTIKDEHECLADGKSKGYGLDRYSGGTPGIAICKARKARRRLALANGTPGIPICTARYPPLPFPELSPSLL